jgi:hypothetical protein
MPMQLRRRTPQFFGNIAPWYDLRLAGGVKLYLEILTTNRAQPEILCVLVGRMKDDQFAFVQV